jgi:mannan endo-1,4-beta-mannosidase
MVRQSKRLWLAGVLVLLLLLSVGAAWVVRPGRGVGEDGAPSRTASTSPETTPSSTGRLWGLWEPKWQAGSSPDFGQYTRVETLLGRPADIVHWYADWTEGWEYDGELVDQVLQRGRTPMITWEPWARPLGAIAAGQFDGYIDSWARGMAARQPQQIYLRIFHEFNDPRKQPPHAGYPWSVGGGTSNRPADLVAAWRHVHDRFALAGASNVRFIWSPDGVHLDPGLLRAAYPGDAHVDFAGWDTYDYDTAANYRTLREVTQKPLVLPEVGSTDPAWVRELMTGIVSGRYGAIQAVVWFDQDGSRLDANPDVTAALRKVLPSFK